MASTKRAAASCLSLSVDTQLTLAKKKVLLSLKPGSTVISQSKSHCSVKVWNPQMPLTSMPSLPSLNRSQSPRPAMSSALGITRSSPRTRASMASSTATFSGVLTVKAV